MMTAATIKNPSFRVAALSMSSSSSSSSKKITQRKSIAVIGGGASGIFSAISAAEHYHENSKEQQQLEIVVLEATSKTLTKVAISGGGRCNGTYIRGDWDEETYLPRCACQSY
jgi:NADH dehydrogenase FAD-containing subunit